MTGFATVTTKYQLTLPVHLAKYAGIKPGSRVYLGIQDEGKIVLERVGEVDELAGMFSDLPLAKKYTVKQAIKLARKKEARRIANEA